MKKKLLSMVSTLLIASLLFAGCTNAAPKESSTGELDQQTAEESQVVDTPTPSGLTVGLVLAGGLGDRSFYDSANAGVEKAGAELGIEYKVYECRNDPTLIKEQMVEAADSSDVIVSVGFEFYDIVQEMAGTFPDKSFIYVDSSIPDVQNLITISYSENQGSFLAGALAAKMTTDTSLPGINEQKIVGMVGGEDIEVIRNFQVGYEAGAKYIDPEVKVETVFAQDFEDPAKGKENATMLYGMGADIIFSVAGKTGEGVFEAAKEQGKYAIGVDSDQRYIAPDNILASMIKEVGQSIYDTIVNVQANQVQPGVPLIYGLAQNGVGLSYGDSTMAVLVSEEVKAEIEEIKGKILSGEIEVPSSK